MAETNTPPAVAVVEPAGLEIPLDGAIVIFSAQDRPAILESSLATGPHARFSILACDPLDEFTHHDADQNCPFHSLARSTARYPAIVNAPRQIPFHGGWIGFFSYEAGRRIESKVPTRPLPPMLPLAHFALYDAAAVYDNVAGEWYVVAVEWPPDFAPQRPPASARLARLRTLLHAAAALKTPTCEEKSSDSTPTPNMSRHEYLARVARAKRYIEAGDIYQVNLAQRWTVSTGEPPLEIYRRLRRVNPSSHAAFIPRHGFAVLSASPELFLDLRGGRVVTRPIKGTRPRSADSVLDSAYRRQLAESEKDRAELNMIIDLMRNDLGRVCAFGSIHVLEAAAVEAHPTVFHNVATIEGRLAPSRNWLDLMLASFPGGSITGAPKIRAMQIIHELEPTGRGVYCGSIGAIGLDRSMSLNVAIRTMLHARGVVYCHAGGAIVADSAADDEYEETLAKAAGMMSALGCALTPVQCQRVKAAVS